MSNLCIMIATFCGIIVLFRTKWCSNKKSICLMGEEIVAWSPVRVGSFEKESVGEAKMMMQGNQAPVIVLSTAKCVNAPANFVDTNTERQSGRKVQMSNIEIGKVKSQYAFLSYSFNRPWLMWCVRVWAPERC